MFLNIKFKQFLSESNPKICFVLTFLKVEKENFSKLTIRISKLVYNPD